MIHAICYYVKLDMDKVKFNNVKLGELFSQVYNRRNSLHIKTLVDESRKIGESLARTLSKNGFDSSAVYDTNFGTLIDTKPIRGKLKSEADDANRKQLADEVQTVLAKYMENLTSRVTEFTDLLICQPRNFSSLGVRRVGDYDNGYITVGGKKTIFYHGEHKAIINLCNERDKGLVARCNEAEDVVTSLKCNRRDLPSTLSHKVRPLRIYDTIDWLYRFNGSPEKDRWDPAIRLVDLSSASAI